MLASRQLTTVIAENDIELLVPILIKAASTEAEVGVVRCQKSNSGRVRLDAVTYRQRRIKA